MAQPTPELIFQTLTAYERPAALKAAIDLDVFTAIADGAKTAKDLAEKCHSAERGVRILCDYLTIVGLLTKQGNSYGLTQDSSVFLNRRSPAYMGTLANFLYSSHVTDSFKDLTATVRNGGAPAGLGLLNPEDPMWVEFAHSMAPLMARPAEEIAKLTSAESGDKWKVLDIAAGHGLFGITIARHNPNAEIVALDWANVLQVAKQNAESAGIGSRYQTLPGSAFDVKFGRDFDLVLITNFLHHFDTATCEAFLKKVHAALKPGGRAVTLEFVPNEDRVSPALPAAFSLRMLAGTPGGDAYTFSELDRMFRNAGFSKTEMHPAPPGAVLISTR
ncbi:MAG: methyltransferase domain-containing protein [Acidobacteriota bacterium]|nr:methyltransferase domain-containing protein [Acidobacteriota bacterium]